MSLVEQRCSMSIPFRISNKTRNVYSPLGAVVLPPSEY